MLDNDLAAPLAAAPQPPQPPSVFDKLSATQKAWHHPHPPHPPLPCACTHVLFAVVPCSQRILGFGLAVTSGVFYGTNFDPPQYLIDKSKKGIEVFGRLHSTQAMDYVFSHFTGGFAAVLLCCAAAPPPLCLLTFRLLPSAVLCCAVLCVVLLPHGTGIFLASTFYFLVYCAYMNNQPKINNQLILPSFCSGTLWAVRLCVAVCRCGAGGRSVGWLLIECDVVCDVYG